MQGILFRLDCQVRSAAAIAIDSQGTHPYGPFNRSLKRTDPMTFRASLPPLFANLRLPVIASPMFIISVPDLVIAQCKAGIVGSFPALNARPAAQLGEWLDRITRELAAHDAANPDPPATPFSAKP